MQIRQSALDLIYPRYILAGSLSGPCQEIVPDMQIQAELGEGHDSIVNAKEAILTEKHLALSLECVLQLCSSPHVCTC